MLENTNMLRITRALPNPIGKDLTPDNVPLNEQLVNEWFQIENLGVYPEDVSNFTFSHWTWDGWQFTGEEQLGWFVAPLVIEPGEALRVHSGIGNAFVLNGVQHVFRNQRNYVLNNVPGDRITLRDANGDIVDSACYEPYPPEGEILFRNAA